MVSPKTSRAVARRSALLVSGFGIRPIALDLKLKLNTANPELIDCKRESGKFSGAWHHAAVARRWRGGGTDAAPGGGVAFGSCCTSGGRATPAALNTPPAQPGA